MKIPQARLRELAVKAHVDPRVIAAVAADPSTASSNMSRSRAAAVLRDAGLLPPEAERHARV
jgi:hypothetical protein